MAPTPTALNPSTPTHDTAQAGHARNRVALEEDMPWRYIGYRGYSKFVSSDSDFLLLRRFRALNVRVGLALQHQLVELERDLEELDRSYEEQEPPIHNGRFSGDEEDRVDLLETIRETLHKYNQFILQQSAIEKYEQAPQRDVKSILRWHSNHDYNAIAAEERQYLSHGLDDKDELVCLVQKDKTPLRRVIDNSTFLRTLWLWRTKKGAEPGYAADAVSYYSDKKMDRFVTVFIVGVGVLMLLVPLWILRGQQNPRDKLIVITVFVFVFLLVLSFAMTSKPFEALGATAAYAAVLMVFLQLGES
ncbi:hypothetical protein FBULB1_1612 [Fusarium bulbicola]|nr:hypothetical protein FBULB1_1612 [Fusarium bulbicola]